MTYQVNLEVAASVTVTGFRAIAALALRITRHAFLCSFVSVVILRAFVFALLPTLVVGTFLANLLVEAVPSAALAPRVAFPTDCFSRQLTKRPLVLGTHVFGVVS